MEDQFMQQYDCASCGAIESQEDVLHSIIAEQKKDIWRHVLEKEVVA